MLYPGEMGAALARAARSTGAEVHWVGAGRSPATRARADALQLREAGSVGEMAARVELVVSICPPEAAVAVAGAVAKTGFSGLYLDANAVSPATAGRVGAIVEAAGAAYVDGGVIGGPDRPHLYVSGKKAAEVAQAFGEPARTTVLRAGGLTAASALKMVYAGWTKGSTALLLALAAASRRLGVEEALRGEWEGTQPGLVSRLAASAGPASKAWRWVGEMDEIAATLEDAGLPGGLHVAAAEVYRRLTAYKDDRTVDVDAVLEALLSGEPGLAEVDDGIVINSEVDRVDWHQAKADLANDRFDNGRSTHALRLSFLRSQHVALAWAGESLVGMARMLSDGVCNSYLLDVWTASDFRRQGVGAGMVKYLLDQVPGQHVGLQTDDAEAFYGSLGFRAQPEFMSVVVGTWLGNAANGSVQDP